MYTNQRYVVYTYMYTYHMEFEAVRFDIVWRFNIFDIDDISKR